jgi:FKBP-type peptidyl-prolyl cis-trans isomerase FklB
VCKIRHISSLLCEFNRLHPIILYPLILAPIKIEMKKLFLLAFTGITLSASAQTPDSTLLKTQDDSLSYILGEISAYYLRQQGLTDIALQPEAYLRAVQHILSGTPALISDASANSMLNNYMMNKQALKAKKNIDIGTAFLEENKKKPGVITTASGLQYEVIKMGTGIKPTLVDTFVAHYRGRLIDGTEFDASYNRGEPLKMAVKQVVKGWQEGLQLMPAGSKFNFYIPYHLAYGMMDQGQIPGGSLLIFELELLDVVKPK